MLRAYVTRADDGDLEQFIDAVLLEIEMLEGEYFFGTEGFEKRFA